MAQIIPIVSEALQASIRRLLPSQRGFGEDLQAQNVIVPIIDLTPTAEGSILEADLQRALSFGNQNSFDISNAFTTVVNTAGFHRIQGNSNIARDVAADVTVIHNLVDALSTKKIWDFGKNSANSMFDTINQTFDYIVYLNAGESVRIDCNNGNAQCAGSVRQIADVTGNLINPVGFTAE